MRTATAAILQDITIHGRVSEGSVKFRSIKDQGGGLVLYEFDVELQHETGEEEMRKIMLPGLESHGAYRVASTGQRAETSVQVSQLGIKVGSDMVEALRVCTTLTAGVVDTCSWQKCRDYMLREELDCQFLMQQIAC